MRSKKINSQLCNWNTYKMYIRKMLNLAESVFIYDNLPVNIDIAYFNSVLVKNGSIAVFKDDILGVIALPYEPLGSLDIYGNPINIMARAFNGQYFRKLTKDDFVIIYDNMLKTSIYLDILQIAERIAMKKRVTDINVGQQKTPRFWITSEDKKKTVESMVNDVDGNMDSVVAYDSIDIDELNYVLAPAPYVTDKIEDSLDHDWAEFFELVGIANLQVKKAERLITNEIQVSMGGTIASRYSRFESRRRAIDKINKKFGTDIKCSFYDGLPSNLVEKEVKKEGDENVGNVSNVSDVS